MWFSLVKAHKLDPGFLPKNVDAYDQALKQVKLLLELFLGFVVVTPLLDKMYA